MIHILNKSHLKPLWVYALLGVWMVGCTQNASRPKYQPIPPMPSAKVLGTLRGKVFERVITHFHTPYSFDACDGHGLDSKGKPNLDCARGMDEAICSNQIDFIFDSDHVNHMVNATFEDLVFTRDPAQQVIASAGLAKGHPVARKVNCASGHVGFLSPGLEGRLLALGMSKHVGGNEEFKRAIYSDDVPRSAKTLREQSEALIIIPHTESRSVELIEKANPDGLEIYNFHANFDPVIREKYLSAPPYRHLFSFVDYIFNPYHFLNPDYLFLEFIQFFPVYFEKWNQLLAKGFHLTGLGGTDAHQNVIAQTMVDGERLDSYRRMTRFMTHLVMVPDYAATDFERYRDTKDAIKLGRVYFVIEGLGTPVQFDFHAETGSEYSPRIHEMGDTVDPSLHPTVVFKLPQVLQTSPGIHEYGQPQIKADLMQVTADGSEKIVSTLTVSATPPLKSEQSFPAQKIVFKNAPTGVYRVRVTMIPSHLRGIVRRGEFTTREYTWMISNSIYVN